MERRRRVASQCEAGLQAKAEWRAASQCGAGLTLVDGDPAGSGRTEGTQASVGVPGRVFPAPTHRAAHVPLTKLEEGGNGCLCVCKSTHRCTRSC